MIHYLGILNVRLIRSKKPAPNKSRTKINHNLLKAYVVAVVIWAENFTNNLNASMDYRTQQIKAIIYLYGTRESRARQNPTFWPYQRNKFPSGTRNAVLITQGGNIIKSTGLIHDTGTKNGCAGR